MNKKNHPDLEIIIVNYNAQFWLKKTLSSLEQHYLSSSKLTTLVTVVDNGSSDESLELLKNHFPRVSVIALPENKGFAAANNVALAKSKAKFVMLLNSDVECSEDSNFDLLVEYLKKNENTAIVTPKVIFSDGTLDPACHRGEPTLWAAVTYFLGLEKLFPQTRLFGQYHQGYKNFSVTHQIDACSGAAMILRRSLIKNVGLLDERFFMYAEDLDWCRRFRDAGYLIVFNPAVSVIHHKYKSGISTTSQSIARNTRRHFYNTMLQYYDKHYSDSYPSLVRKLIQYFIVLKKGAL